ncbi:MAG: nuclear transport factor 2 family protein [Planctomycetia bacterium]|nr:nuclear transport factor 2 family protein [Planctomycetia bacterium]
MNWKPLVLATGVVLMATTHGRSQTTRKPAVKPAAKAPAAADVKAAPIDAVKASAQAFADAFNKHDAKAVAALWTEDGEYVDEAGQRFEGRAAIEREYAEFFTAQPNAKLTVVVDAVRPVGEAAAIEDGHTELSIDGKTVVSAAQYTAVHAKIGTQWLMLSVRDQRISTEPSASQLQDLAWLVGSWQAEQNGGQMQVDCHWLGDGHFLARKSSVKRGDQDVADGWQVIGWNAQSQAIESWTFSSDGGRSVGYWIPHRGGWIIEHAGTMADGTPTAAVNYFVRLDDNSHSWKSVERSVGGALLPESAEIVLKRVSAQP